MTQPFINIYDRSISKTAVLQNAWQIVESQELNQIYRLKFSLPSDDVKNEFCEPFHFVRHGDSRQLYRIHKTDRQEAATGQITYECEHAVTTLCDTLLFGSYTYGGTGYRTKAAIQWLLSKQKIQNWKLGKCDFDEAYEYLWEEENLLNALYSIPKPFTSPYKWVFDCRSYPWTLSLKRIDETADPEFYIRAKRNLLSSGVSQDSSDICTRIYPLGYGEGVNQLTIKDVNNGKTYLEAPAAVIQKYGIIERVLVDRSFENAESLKAYGQKMLDELSSPTAERSFDVVDLYPITSADIDQAEVGKICKMTGDNSIAYITRTERVLDEQGNLQISLSNKASSVADTIADLADRVRIETVYSQGATQLYQHSKDANATSSKGMILSLYFPDEMRQINKVLLKVQLDKFRAYSQTTESGGGETATSEDGGEESVTSEGGSAGGQTSASTNDSTISAEVTSDTIWDKEGGNVFSTTPGSFNGYTISLDKESPYYLATETPNSPQFSYHGHYLYSPFPHSHKIAISNITLGILKTDLAHTHKVKLASVGSHRHSFSVGSHTHKVTIKAHTHKVPIKAHTHEIKAGIFESGSASAFDLYVSGKKKTTINAKSWESDITEWLLNNDGKIPRNSWIKVEIRPNDLAYVISSVFVQGFVQSRGDKTV